MHDNLIWITIKIIGNAEWKVVPYLLLSGESHKYEFVWQRPIEGDLDQGGIFRCSWYFVARRCDGKWYVCR